MFSFKKVFRQVKLNILFLIPVILSITFGIFLRLYLFWNNSFVGDEVNTLEYLAINGYAHPKIFDFYNFLLLKNRGPGQYLVNYLNTSIFGFINEFQIRLPYVFISIVALIVIYFLTYEFFKSKKVALISVSLFSFNGLFIIFGRLAQYQSFLVFFIPLTVYFFTISYLKNNKKLMFLSAILYSICLLFHYDSLSLLPYFISLITYNIYLNTKKSNLINTTKLILIFILVVSFFSIVFYLPFFSHQYYSIKTSSYLESRLFGGGFMPKTPYFELGQILELYLPLEAWFILFFLLVLGFVFLHKKIINKVKLFKISFNHLVPLYYLANILFVIGFLLSLTLLKPRLSTLLVYISSFVILFLLFISKKIGAKLFALIAWFLVNFCVYFYFIKDPRTHVYVVFFPAFILVAYSINNIFEIIKNKYFKFVLYMLLNLLILLLFYFYYLVFIQINPPYLWYKKTFIFKELPYVDRNYKSNLKIFGFGDNNHWLEIKKLYDMGCLVKNYGTNEKISVSNFYMQTKQISLNDQPETVIFVVNPTTWSTQKLQYYSNNNEYILLKTYYNGDYPSVYLFGKKIAYKTNKTGCFK